MPQLTRNHWQNTSPARPSKTTSTTKDPSRLQSSRNLSLKRTTLGILVASLFTLGLTFSPAARATDGIAEINETCAVQTGCFPGDSPGYPVTIDGQVGRSYRLTSDLIVPDENTDGIQVATSDVGIDLNNFSIIRSGCEGATANCTPASGTGSGIERTSSLIRGTSVKNGSITGMGSQGVLVGDQSEVTGLRVRWNRLDGIYVGVGSTVSGNMAYGNGGDGVDAGTSSTVSGNTVYVNGGDGINANTGSTISGNTSRSNGGDGINANTGSTVSENTAYGNDGDGIFASNGSTLSGNTAYTNGDDGIATFAGSTVSGNTSYSNDGDGIETNRGCSVQHNTVRFNVGFGLNLNTESAYLGNVVSSNTTGTVTGGGSGNSRGGNFCSGTGTGSNLCP